MKKQIILSAFLLMAGINLSAQKYDLQKAREIVSQMTLDEKVNLVVGMGMNIPGMDMSSGPVVGQTMDKVPGAAGTTFAIERLGIKNTVMADGPAGLRIMPTRENDSRTYYATAFPVASLLASTWDKNLVKKVGEAMGNEVKEYGVDFFLAPAMNIHRNPLGGRNFEYYSEDPVVSGNIASAMVNGIESNGVGTSIKHFAANNQETNRNLVNTIVSERALREIYLRGFEIAIKQSQPWTVMSSYNKINGIYTSEDRQLLTTILRDEWGFKGYVMTDWFGGKNAVEQMKVGNDLLMPGTKDQKKQIMDALVQGQLTEKIIDENAARIISVNMQSPSFAGYEFSNKPDLQAHARVARAAAAEGMVLLKNDNNTLPLKNNVKKIAVLGNTSYDFISGGTGSGDVNEAYTISLVQGLNGAGLAPDDEMAGKYESYIRAEKDKQPAKTFMFELPQPIDELNISTEQLLQLSKDNDVAIITIGRNAGEFQDRKTTDDYYLKSAELELIKNVSEAFHSKGKKLIVILNVGGVMDVTAWKDNADVILLAWQGGQEAGNAVADILSGKVNPSGKLATTFPLSYDDVPSAKNFPGKNLSDVPATGIGGFQLGFDSEVMYEEGIFVGYRYYNTFKIKPAFEFGYGLSYTNFQYSNLKLNTPVFKDKLLVSVDITNTGKVAGKEAVQLYLSAPSKKMYKPVLELKSFEKTNLLNPGQKQTITFVLEPKDLASFDTPSSSWIAEAGTYTVKIGASSLNIKQTKTFALSKELMVEKCHQVMAPQVQLNELKP